MLPAGGLVGGGVVIAVDLFAGGGGASEGIRRALGVEPVIAVNHCPHAIEMHRRNHPRTVHFRESVYDVDPLTSVGGRAIDLLWASPDCKHHSRAKGGKPLDKDIRGLAWVLVDWAREVRPRVIMAENVREFEDWGPLYPADHPVEKLRNRPIPERKGETFREFIQALRDEGYVVEWRVLNAAEYGTPQARHRWFMIARCDGRPIVWPEPTHGEGLLPQRPAGDCIDWSIPSLSIFATRQEARAWRKRVGAAGTPKRPLAEATLRRIAAGTVRYVIEDPNPYIVGDAAHTLINTRNGERKGQAPRTRDIRRPLGTVTAQGSQGALVSAFLAKHNGSGDRWNAAIGQPLRDPLHTVTGRDTKALVSAHLTKFYGTCAHGQSLHDPMPTITAGAGGGHAGLVSAFLCAYYGSEKDGQSLHDPLRTVTGTDRFSLVTVDLDGEPWAIVDIAMRMLQPRELLRATMGPEHADRYILTGTAKQQTARVGNMVCPHVVEAIVRAQFAGEAPREVSPEGWLFGEQRAAK